MPIELRDVLRVRTLRLALAGNEAVRLRGAVVRAERAIAEAHRQQAARELEAATAASSFDQACGKGALPFTGEDASRRMALVTAARMKVREAAAQIRRAELVLRRATEEADEASDAYRRQLMRRDAVKLRAVEHERGARLRRIDRDEQVLLDERIGGAVVPATGHIGRQP